MKYANMLDEMYINKQANEDDDKDVVCNNCGKPMSVKNGPGCCTCNGGKGTSTKKEFLENELAKKLASEELDELYLEKQAGNIKDDLSSHLKGMKGAKKETADSINELKSQGEALKSNLGNLNTKTKGKVDYGNGPKLGIKLGNNRVDADEFRKSVKDTQERLDNVGSRIENAIHDANKSVTEAVKDYSNTTGSNAKSTIEASLPKTSKGVSKGLKRAGLVGAGIAGAVGVGSYIKHKNQEKKASEVLDEMYKEAGIITTTMAGMTGLGTGAMLGATAGNVRNKLTLDKDRKRLVQELKDARKERSKASNDAMNYENQIHEELGKKYKAYIMSMSPEKRKKLTVGDVEKFLSNNIPDFKKEASAEGVAFAAGAGLGAWTGYRCKTDKHTMQNTIKRHKDATAQHRASLTPEGKGKLRGSLLDYSPINTDMDRDEVNYYKDVLDGELKKQGINPNSMNLREYKGLMRNFINLDQKGEAENFDMYDPDHYARKAIDKHMSRLASEVLDEMYMEKQADVVDLSNARQKKQQAQSLARKFQMGGEEYRQRLLGSLDREIKGLHSFEIARQKRLGSLQAQANSVSKLLEGLKDSKTRPGIKSDVKSIAQNGSKLKRVAPVAVAGAIATAPIAAMAIHKNKQNKNKLSKKASEVLDEMYKEASGDKVGKWTNKDKKGLVRNMAINVAQDFVNAGNPLNVGSHIVGSVMDSALMEGMTMKMNKKLQAQKINQKSMNHFNDAKGLSNGTTAVKAVKSTPGAVKKITSGNNN